MLTVLFALEMVLKHVAVGCKRYWDDSFNTFDGVIVIVSVVEILVVAITGANAGGGVSALRALRLLRVLKVRGASCAIRERGLFLVMITRCLACCPAFLHRGHFFGLQLARSWESLNEILAAMGSSLRKIAPFSIILLLFMFIYSLLGMQVRGMHSDRSGGACVDGAACCGAVHADGVHCGRHSSSEGSLGPLPLGSTTTHCCGHS